MGQEAVRAVRRFGVGGGGLAAEVADFGDRRPAGGMECTTPPIAASRIEAVQPPWTPPTALAWSSPGAPR